MVLYTNDSVGRTPSFVIDKPHIDSRAWGWLMEEWNVDGLLNWGFNRWGKASTGEGWRDPYRDPLSLIKGHLRSNGDTCLVYPGYYPRYGLTDETAGPVASLRLEALRDGLEEREYLRIAKTLPGGGARTASVARGRSSPASPKDPAGQRLQLPRVHRQQRDVRRSRASRSRSSSRRSSSDALTPERGQRAGRRT